MTKKMGRPLGQLVLALGAMIVVLAACTESRGDLSANEADGELLYVDDFGDVAVGSWLLEGDDLGSTAIEDGRLYIDVAQVNSMQYTALEDPEFTDFDLVVDAELIDGERDATYGVMFRMAGPEEFYRFELTGDGRYIVERRDLGGTWQRLVDGWQTSTAIETGPGAVNRLRITADGQNMNFYANDELLEELQDGRYIGGRIALDAGTFGGQRTVVAFDNLAMRLP